MQLNEIHFKTIDSTNTFARNNAQSIDTPALITAQEQTAGRGRRGKSFYSPANTGIYFTLLFEPDPGFNLITPAAAVCVCESIREFTGLETRIKWVNDIFSDGKKICGILCERFFAGRSLVAAGIGINLNTEVFPPDIPQAGSLGVSIDGVALSRDISERLLKINENPDSRSIFEKYRERLSVIGKRISYEKNGITFEGTAVGINEDCNLIVKTEIGGDILSSGEISVKIKEEV